MNFYIIFDEQERVDIHLVYGCKMILTKHVELLNSP